MILHGWGGSSDSWLAVQAVLGQRSYQVVVPDFPGFGKSAPPPVPWGIDEYTDFILKFIGALKSRGELTEPFFLLGHSFGGRISINFSAQYPEKIKKLILCDSGGIKLKPGLKTMLIYWAARIGNALFTPKHLQRLKDSARNLFYAFLRNKDYVKAKGTMRETIKKVINDDLFGDLAKIKTNTLIIWGGKDKMIPLKYAYIFKEKILGSSLEIIPGIGHSPHLEVPEKLAEIILKFIG